MTQFSVGLIDRLFGKRTTLEIPGGNGKIIKRTVTEKWLETMQKQGKMSIVTDIVRAHILDPMADEGYGVSYWKIGEYISAEQVDTFKDPETGDIYILVVYEGEGAVTRIIKKEIFEQVFEEFRNIG
jgi:hypothetical protein